MKSIYYKAAIAAAAAMVAAHSFAEGGNSKSFYWDPPSTSTLSRAEVRAELQESRREGFTLTIDNSYPAKTTAAAQQDTTRAEVRAEVAASGGPMASEEPALYSH
jgi:hypothetical protein